MNVKIFDKDTHSDFCFFELEDEVDCAILGDQKFDDALNDIKEIDPEKVYPEEDIIDTTIDYDDTIPEADLVGLDADEFISAERDIAFDPLGEDELIDIAIEAAV